MSFITKRERVFNEYDLFDLPARNEGKLKAYASCTDARAWSHFCSDKSEHLVEIIKRNNETVRPKYLPTNVIVDTLMVAKNAEIARLKQKIEQFEQMLAAYDQLELSCAQKCEIADAHAAIKAANKELNDMCLDLDLSGFTEVLDSETYETGKSRGDGEEIMPQMYDHEGQATPMTEVKASQISINCTCEAETLAIDPRIDEMQETIIGKDAKLNAMKNTIAVMEIDLCEPYCIYAHIYTALEKIFGILCQNDKYRQYLNLLTAGKNTQCIDIRGKILFKLKVLEKFCGALIAPCNQQFNDDTTNNDCECYRSEVITRIETNYAITSAELSHTIDNKRAHLVADIIQNEEMKEILSKDSFSVKQDTDILEDVYFLHEFNIDSENLNRLKKLQENYDDLMTCYESLKHENECLGIRCHKYAELEKEFENLKIKVNEYNSLWNEKEHYRKRSADLDTLKEQYLILTDETTNLETQLKAESEINNIKCKTIEDLRNENVRLEKKLNDALLIFEKEKSTLLCKLKEADCRVLCQGQQIKSLSIQIDRLLEQDQKTLSSQEAESTSLALIDEVESNRDQIKNLKDALFCNEEEKQGLQQRYQDQLKLITELRSELDDWKCAYEKTLQRNDYLEKYTESLLNETRVLTEDVKKKSEAVENLLKIVGNKSQEINKLIHDSEKSKKENKDLAKQINELQKSFNSNVVSLETEKVEALKYLQLAREESEELLQKVKDYNEVMRVNDDVMKSLDIHEEIRKELDDNKSQDNDLASSAKNNSMLKEIQRLRELHKFVVSNVNSLEDANKQYKTSLQITQKESGQLKIKLSEYENLSLLMKNLQSSYDKLLEEKNRLETELMEKGIELENALLSIQITKRESYDLIDKLQQSQNIKDELLRLSDAYKKLAIEKHAAQTDLLETKTQMENLLQSLTNMKLHNECLLQQCGRLDEVERELQDTKKAYNSLLSEKNTLLDGFNDKKEREFNNLYDMLEKKIEENRELTEQISSLQENQAVTKNSMQSLQDDNLRAQATLNVIKKESADLLEQLRHYKTLETEFEKLKRAHDQMKIEKEKLQTELNVQLADLKRIEEQNSELHCHSQNLIIHSEQLEKALINSRTELIKNTASPDNSYKHVLMEIDDMKREKMVNQKKIRDLRDKLKDSETTISNLSEELMIRNDKIAILENHINELEDEVRKLHINLVEVVDTGEEMKEYSFQKIDSIKNIEAHHSKATHNMKMELAKLQQHNAVLEEQLSVSKKSSEESSRDNNRFVSELVHLCNEREIIVTEIKGIEVTSLGDSALSPTNCDIEDILLSLDRIRKCYESKNSKSSLLEQTILKVQTSSQLLLSKADEAKRLVEKEKQKIISEKEDAIRDRQNMEKQMVELKEKLEKQMADDKSVIQDLEAMILNQKLIIDKINKSTQDYISKLKEELQSLQNLYSDSITKINELQEELQNITEDRNCQKKILENLKVNFETKSEEICELKKELEKYKNKHFDSTGTQTKTIASYRSRETEIEKELLEKGKIHIGYDDAKPKPINRTLEDLDKEDKLKQSEKAKQHNADSEIIKQENTRQNEVQVLTANVISNFDYVKTSYKEYKIKCLSTGKMEQCSISCPSDKEINEDQPNSQSPGKEEESEYSFSDIKAGNSNLNDTYNKGSNYKHTSRPKTTSGNILVDKHNPKKASALVGFVITDNSNGKHKDSENVPINSASLNKDLLIIYKDSHTSSINREQEKDTWSDMTIETTKGNSKKDKNDDVKYIVQDSYSGPDDRKDDKDKTTLKIKMPRVENESNNSLMTTSDYDKKSLGSYTLDIYSSPKQTLECVSVSDTRMTNNGSDRNTKNSTPSLQDLYNNISHSHGENTLKYDIYKKVVKSNASSKSIKNNVKRTHTISNEKDKIPIDGEQGSNHKLLRVDADVLLLNTEETRTRLPNDKVIQKIRDFGLEYILDIVQGEFDPIKTKNFTENIAKLKEEKSRSLSKLNDSKVSSTENKTISILSRNSNNSISRAFSEKSVMVQLDTKVDYDNTIDSLTKALENVEKDYKKKIEAIKMQYDNNIKSIINDHNQGVKNIQNLHEETLQDMLKIHENEVENLRSMSIEAMRKAEKLEKENRALKTKISDRGMICLEEEPIKMSTHDLRKRKKCRGDTKLLTKTTVEAFNVKPKPRMHGPCTCTLDVNISDTIRNIFEQVDVEQRKMAEHTYLKYIANKMLNGNIEVLDGHELSFLHLKVCRMWKTKLSKEEALRRRIDSLETELVNKQRNTQQHIADLDRKVAEERRRLQEVCEAVCRASPRNSRPSSPATEISSMPPPSSTAEEQKFLSTCACNGELGVRGSAGDLTLFSGGIRTRCTTTRNDKEKGALAKLDVEDRRREKKLYNDEPPTRLRRSHDRQVRSKK
ncbi:unnamed protein product [Arctia plantaginis]|uniref:Uncharacterized protein n=1 Tax=Arctia plantaginis TaxID=874455 RepID=A0A8S1AR20_ARCPL|nr:unnamed protein product [Arctia plantaginis]